LKSEAFLTELLETLYRLDYSRGQDAGDSPEIEKRR
jgi:hypothetical protein